MMSNPPSKPPASTPPSTSPLKNSTPDHLALAAKLGASKALAAMQSRIGRAIFGITEKVSTQLRAYVDGYFRHVSPTLANNGDAFFPTCVRRHPVHRDRTTVTDRASLLYFLIGSTILDYYDAVRAETPPPQTLDERVKLLEDIAKRGFNQFVRHGTDLAGFTLLHRDDVPIPFSKELIDGEDDRSRSEDDDDTQPA
jgi:hypothetical protein